MTTNIFDNDKHALFPIRGGHVIVDKEDLELIKDYNWFIDRDGYATAFTVIDEHWKSVRVHLLVRGKAPQGYIVDHINRVKLDCRKSNLRHATHKENYSNRGIPPQDSTILTDEQLKNQFFMEDYLNGNPHNNLRTNCPIIMEIFNESSTYTI